MPAYNKGNVIRGGFGSTFRRIVCHANCREPESCELRGATVDHESLTREFMAKNVET
jgi:hypothetical protein